MSREAFPSWDAQKWEQVASIFCKESLYSCLTPRSARKTGACTLNDWLLSQSGNRICSRTWWTLDLDYWNLGRRGWSLSGRQQFTGKAAKDQRSVCLLHGHKAKWQGFHWNPGDSDFEAPASAIRKWQAGDMLPLMSPHFESLCL